MIGKGKYPMEFISNKIGRIKNEKCICNSIFN